MIVSEISSKTQSQNVDDYSCYKWIRTGELVDQDKVDIDKCAVEYIIGEVYSGKYL